VEQVLWLSLLPIDHNSLIHIRSITLRMFVLRHALTRRTAMTIHTPRVRPVRPANAGVQSLLAVLIVLGATHGALAADCLEQPDLQKAQDGHWYHRFDSINHRKCWYRKPQPPSAESSTVASNTTVEGTISFTSFLSSLLSGRPNAVSTLPQQQNAAAVATPSAPNADPGASKRNSLSYERRRLALRTKQPEGRGDHQYPDPAQREELFEEFLRWAAWQDAAQSSGGQ
jgi:hypothetical protein